jgi:signal transduction histidine kinase
MLLLAQVVSALCYGLAAALFTIQAGSSEDELLGWVGPAFVLGAFSRLNYLLFPSLYTDWLYTGDLLRTGCHALLLLGATREIQQYWTAQADVAVLEDRRRLARELHDGVIQELSYIKSASYALPAAVGGRESILGACDRALDEARAAVHALGSARGEPLGDTLQRAVRQLAERHSVAVDFDLADSVLVTSDQRHALVRIAREAVNNAVRHGKAGYIRVTLENSGPRRCLSILDDGSGFDVGVGSAGSASPTGYGLTSMRDRAQGLPGELRIESTPGQGSVVEVKW